MSTIIMPIHFADMETGALFNRAFPDLAMVPEKDERNRGIAVQVAGFLAGQWQATNTPVDILADIPLEEIQSLILTLAVLRKASSEDKRYREGVALLRADLEDKMQAALAIIDRDVLGDGQGPIVTGPGGMSQTPG